MGRFDAKRRVNHGLSAHCYLSGVDTLVSRLKHVEAMTVSTTIFGWTLSYLSPAQAPQIAPAVGFAFISHDSLLRVDTVEKVIALELWN